MSSEQHGQHTDDRLEKDLRQLLKRIEQEQVPDDLRALAKKLEESLRQQNRDPQ